MTRKEFIITATLLASILIGVCAPTLAAAVVVATRPDPEAQYWRGVYDVCLAQTHNPALCLDRVADFYERREDWYGAPSPGWEWPLPRPVGPAY
jgi:hypothetical protein